MKKVILALILFSCFSQLYAQIEEVPEKRVVSVGILHGGGGLLGFDMEILLTERFGFQMGAGLVSYGAGINMHTKPGIRSPFFSMQLWNQGLDNHFVQRVVGPSYVYRGNKWLTAQIGLGHIIKKGPAFPEERQYSPIILTYAIGVYIPR